MFLGRGRGGALSTICIEAFNVWSWDRRKKEEHLPLKIKKGAKNRSIWFPSKFDKSSTEEVWSLYVRQIRTRILFLRWHVFSSGPTIAKKVDKAPHCRRRETLRRRTTPCDQEYDAAVTMSRGTTTTSIQLSMMANGEVQLLRMEERITIQDSRERARGLYLPMSPRRR